MDTIVVATGNKHKVQEIGEILGARGYHVIGAQEMGGMPDVVEDGLTFQDNATKKALETAQKWDAVFRKLDAIFPENTSEGFVASLMYGNGMSQDDVCRFTHCARVTVRRRRDRYVIYAATLAATMGLIKTEEVKSDGGTDPEE